MKLAIMAVTNPAGVPVSNTRLSLKDVRASLFRMLKENVLCSVATVTSGPQPYVSTAYFSYSNDLELYFLSHPESQHCRNLDINPSMAMTVFSSSQTWGGLDHGLQFFGTCEVAQGAHATKARNSYKKRFPAYASWRKSLRQDDPGKSYRLYRFVPTRVKVLDEQWKEPFAVARISR